MGGYDGPTSMGNLRLVTDLTTEARKVKTGSYTPNPKSYLS